MKSFWVCFVSGFVLLFSFQNCQKSPAADEFNVLSSGLVVGASTSNKVILAEQKLKEIEFIVQENQTLLKSGQTFTLIAENAYRINLADGHGMVQSGTGQVQKTFCLTQELKSELNSILQSSSVCLDEKKEKSDDQVCLQAIKNPYAKILTDNDHFELGFATDSCGSNSVDLCADQSDLLKGFITHLKLQVSLLTCQ